MCQGTETIHPKQSRESSRLLLSDLLTRPGGTRHPSRQKIATIKYYYEKIKTKIQKRQFRKEKEPMPSREKVISSTSELEHAPLR